MTTYRIIDDMDIAGDRLSAMIRLLPQWRQDAAMRFRHESGRRECCLSYLLLCDILRHDFGITLQPDFVIGEHGKPSLAFDGDIPCRPLTFSISHCRCAIACAVSDEADVGMDVERTGRYSAPLAEYSMSEEELQRIAGAADPDAEFTMLWTRKEALLKLTGEGITDDLKNVLTSQRANGVEIQTRCRKDRGYAWSMAVRKLKQL